jgi:hypothetical protein
VHEIEIRKAFRKHVKVYKGRKRKGRNRTEIKKEREIEEGKRKK